MPKQLHILIMSESQIFKTQNQMVSISAFMYKMQLSTKDAIAVVANSNLLSVTKSYKQGQIQTEEFLEKLGSFVSSVTKGKISITDQEAKECWNKMCEFQENSKKETTNLVKFLKENEDYRVLFVNDTNELQHDFNIEQCKEILGERDFEDIFKLRVFYANSYEHKILDNKQELAAKGLESFNKEHNILLDRDVKAIISFHRDIKSSDLLEKEGFQAKVSNIITQDMETKEGNNIIEKISEAKSAIDLSTQNKVRTV